MLFNIAVIEKWSAAALAPSAGAVCHKKMKRLKAFVPRKLVRIVTVNPPNVFSTLKANRGQQCETPAEPHLAVTRRSY
jgi:hypothetical protein